MRSFLAAIQFITLLPAGKTAVYQPRGMIAWFPAVGLFLGLLLAVFDALVCRLWPGVLVPAALDVVLLIVMTGALHIDGLADSADGLFGHRDKDTVLSIMKDSRIGVMGLAAVVCGLAIKFTAIASIPLLPAFDRFFILLLVPGLARAAMIFGIKSLPYGRPGGGTGYDLFDAPLDIKNFWGLALCLLPALLLGWRGIWLILLFFALVYAIIFYYRRRMGCITGDMLGAMTEVSESLLFLAASVAFFQGG